MPEAIDLSEVASFLQAGRPRCPTTDRRDAEIDTLLTIASRVPDHGKLTPWRFIVFTGEARARASETLARDFREEEPAGDRRPARLRAQALHAGAAGGRGGAAAPRRM